MAELLALTQIPSTGGVARRDGVGQHPTLPTNSLPSLTRCTNRDLSLT
jgi:hypothetical protein